MLKEVMSEQPNTPLQEPHRYTVLGSGVIGLLTANVLAEQGHNVTVISKEGQPNIETSNTSANAIGQFLPWVPEEHAESLLGGVDLAEVTEFSRQFYADLARDPHTTGVMEVNNVELIQSSKPWPSGLPEAMDVKEHLLDKAVPFVDPNGEEIDFDEAVDFETFSINARKTVAHLAAQAEKLGVKFVAAHLKKEDLNELDGIIINATGFGAREIDTTQQVNHFKGHTFLLRPRPGQVVPTEALSVDDLILMPREDGTIICGALYIEDPLRPVPEATEAEELFDRLSKLCAAASEAGLVDGLEADLIEKSDIIVHNAGYRVEVEGSGIRVVPDEENQRLLHAYGFGGIGWSVGPHFAKRIAEQANALHAKIKE